MAYRVAELNVVQLRLIHALEEVLGLVLIAYQKEEGE